MSFKIQRGLFKFELTDYHAILGIPLAADPNLIRKRYLKIAHSLHPDTCKAVDDSERRQASELLSKLVNPAYENLKGKTRHEYQIVLSQMGKRLAKEGGATAVTSAAAKALLNTNPATLEAEYQKALKALTATQYQSLGAIADTIGDLSELNLVYLMRKEGAGLGQPAASRPATSRPAASPPAAPGAPPSQPADDDPPPPSMLDPYIRRAREYMEKNNFSKAVLELRDGLKLDPNDSTCHSLMGLTYLKQNQVSMAKVHISKALQADPQNSLAQKADQALARAIGKKTAAGSRTTASNGKQKPNEKTSGGRFGGLFGSSGNNTKKK